MGKFMMSDVRKKWKISSISEKMENESSDAMVNPSRESLESLRPLWRTAAEGLKPLRLPRA